MSEKLTSKQSIDLCLKAKVNEPLKEIIENIHSLRIGRDFRAFFIKEIIDEFSFVKIKNGC